jgi:hypothetical protein
MARYVLVLDRQDPLRGALEGVGPENRDFFGPEMATREASAISGPKKSSATLRLIDFNSFCCRRIGVRAPPNLSQFYTVTDWLIYLKQREKKDYERGNEVTGGGGVNETTAKRSDLFNTFPSKFRTHSSPLEAPETRSKRQATQHGCLPRLLGDGDKGIEIVFGEGKNIWCWAD